MQVVYFKTDTSEPVRVLCTTDGRIDFSELGGEFGLDPTSIHLNGARVPKTGLKSEPSWEQIERIFQQDGRYVGTKDDPVMVTGEARVHAVSSGLVSGVQLAENHPLSRFVACLKDSTLQESVNNATAGSVIKLPEGIVWLGNDVTFSNKLFMRPCYFELVEAKEEYFKLNRKFRAVVYTGTPGIGKSHLCAYVIAKKLVSGTTIFFETGPTSSMKGERTAFYRLDLVEGVSRLESFGVLDYVPVGANAIYIVDGGPPSSKSPILETQIFASPSKALFVPKTKAWPYLYLHTPLFDFEEMCSCRLAISEFATKVTMEAVEEWFFIAGGVARVVLRESSAGKSLSAWKDEALSRIAGVDVSALQIMIAGLQLSTFAPGSDSLFHWHVNEKSLQESTTGSSPEKKSLRRFQRKMVCFASDWIAKQFYLKMRLENILKVVSFILSNTGDVEVAALRGYWFETVSHMILSSGGTFRCRWLDTGELFELTLPEAELCTFKGNEDASLTVKDDLSVYCLPMVSNQVAIDSMSSPYLLFQMTSSTAHSINKEGLSKFLKALEDRNRFTQAAGDFVKSACVPPRLTATSPLFAFCTTPANFQSHYQTPQIFVHHKRKADGELPIQQLVLEIPIDFLEVRFEGELRLKAVGKPR